jgi:hypothetical protein
MNWRRCPDIKTTLLPDGYVALSTENTDWIHILNPIGALVWELSDGDLSTDEIITQIENLIQPPDRAALKGEIDQFAKELLENGLLNEK